MKASPRDIPGYLKSLDPGFRAVLVFGKDSGLIRETRDRLSKQILGEDPDPFCLASLSREQIKDDKTVIADEMAAVSMMGGRRLVRIDDAGDPDLDAVKNALEMETGDSLLLLSGGDLGPRSKLRVFFEKENGVLAIACYADSTENLSALITRAFRRFNIEAAPEVLEYLKDHLGADRIVTRSELEKIVFYLGAKEGDIGPPRHLSLEDAKTLTSDSAEMTLNDIARETLSGNTAKLSSLLDKARVEGTGAIEILRVVQAQFIKLNLVRGLMDEGVPMNDAIRQLRPPIFFKERDAFVAQVKSWPGPKLLSGLDYLNRAEAACKRTGAPDFTIAAKTCMDICLKT